MDTYTVSFFGHRQVENFFDVERRLEALVRELLHRDEYVVFLVGRNGEFDQIATSTVRRVRRAVGGENSSLVLVLPYMTAEYANNQESFENYYDEIEISEVASGTHFKAAIQARNRNMVDRSDMVIFYVKHKSGGAYRTMQYAEKQWKKIINVADDAARHADVRL